MQKTVKIAGHVFLIESIGNSVHQFIQNYFTEEPAEFYIKITPEDIASEKAETAKEYAGESLPLPEVPDDMYELTLIYRKIVESLFPFDILLYHGSAIAVNGRAHMFIAKSGTGKSTHTGLWRELLGGNAIMVNDDKPLIQISDKGVLAYGTPWSGKHHLNTNIAVPLKSICIVNRGENNSIREISLSEAYPMLLQQTYRVPGKENLKKTMLLIDKMAQHVRFYSMACNIRKEAAEMAYHAMHEGDISP